MNVLLSDGTQVPVTVPGWARAMRSALAALAAKPTLCDVGDLRKLLQWRPVHYLGRDWEQLVADCFGYLGSIELSLEPLAHGGQAAGDPLEPEQPNLRVVGA
jgi:hypothetical protein